MALIPSIGRTLGKQKICLCQALTFWGVVEFSKEKRDRILNQMTKRVRTSVGLPAIKYPLRKSNKIGNRIHENRFFITFFFTVPCYS